MSLASIGAPVSYPSLAESSTWWGNSTQFSSSASWALNGTQTIQAAVFVVPKTGSIDTVGFRTAAVANSADAVRVSLQSLDGSGNASGTILASGAAFGSLASGMAANTWNAVSLGTPASVTVGDRIAIVLDYVSRTTGDVSISVCNAGSPYTSLPYLERFASAAWTKASLTGSYAVRYTDTTWPFTGLLPASAAANQTYNKNTALDTTGKTGSEVGNAIVMPFSARAVGAWWWGNPATSADLFTINLYSGTTVQGTYTGDPDEQSNNSVAHMVHFAGGPVTLSAGSTYYIVLTPNQTNATNVILYGMQVSVAAQLGAWPGGTNVYEAYRSGGGANAWNTATDRRMAIGLLIDQLDDGAGGGGSTLINCGEY